MTAADREMERRLAEYFEKKGRPLKWCQPCKDWIPTNEEHFHMDTSSAKSALRKMRGKMPGRD